MDLSVSGLHPPPLVGLILILIRNSRKASYSLNENVLRARWMNEQSTSFSAGSATSAGEQAREEDFSGEKTNKLRYRPPFYLPRLNHRHGWSLKLLVTILWFLEL